jgi:hypothetical protein
MGTICCPETSVRNYHPTLCNVPEERRHQRDIVCQCNETNVMHFLFSLLRINASTCFERYLLIFRRRCISGTWYIACVLCQLAAPEFIPSADFVSPPEDEQVILETCTGISS